MTIDELKNILKKHKKWLAGNPDGERANLCMADLRGADLCGADLRVADLHRVDLRDADLRGADLRGADLYRVDLRDANLCMADLRGADLRKADLRGADLCKVDLRGADLIGADLDGADLDYSAWPLWCGSFDVKVDKRIAAQLAYHFCRLDCDDPEYQEAKKSLSKLANQFHRIDECGRIEDHA